MLVEFINWWAEQLQDLLPQRLSMRLSYDNAVIARAGSGILSLAVRRRGTELALGTVDSGNETIRRLRARPPGPIVLALPADALLEQPVSLPLAAERDLGAILRHEMDRLTPFRADDLFWTWRLDQRDRNNGCLKLRLLLIPKRGLVPVLAALDAVGLSPAALEVAGSTGQLEHLPLAMQEPSRSLRGSTRFASSVCTAVALLAVATPMLRQEWAIAKAENIVEALRPQVALVDSLRRRIGVNASGTNLFAAERARAGNPLRALAAVTTALPDDTYLTAFALRNRVLSMAGQSGSAARLIAALSTDPALRNSAFDAPITRVSDRAELFSIRAEFSP